jgi:hypothetical protein
LGHLFLGKIMNDILRLRFLFCLIGGLAGYSAYLFFELPDQFRIKNLDILFIAWAFAFFFTLLALLGHVKVMRAIIASFVIAVIGAVLMYWASWRFAPENRDLVFLASVFCAMVMMASPFVIVRLKTPQDWTSYGALFQEEWSMVVRGFLSAIFTGVFWVVYNLSAYLLKLVGISILSDMLDHEWFIWILTGVAFGVGLAVTLESAKVIDVLRGLVLQLLRLLLPLVTVVTALFLIMLPIKGIENLFQQLSVGGTMMGIALVGVTLIAASIDSDDDRAASAKILAYSARLMAIMLPIVALLVIYAIWLRVAQYGWTPSRVWATVFSVIVFGYTFGLGAYAAFGGQMWRNGVRQSWVYMALGVIGIGALCLSPLINPERIAVNSQIGLYRAGLITPQKMPLWALAHQWGVAGQDGVAQLRQEPEFRVVMGQLDESTFEFQFNNAMRDAEVHVDLLAELKAIMPVFPDGQTIDHVHLSESVLKSLLASCKEVLRDGQKGCAAIIGDFDAEDDGMETLFITVDVKGERLQTRLYYPEIAKRGRVKYEQHYGFQSAEDLMIAIHSGSYDIAPSQTFDLSVGGKRLKIHE